MPRTFLIGALAFSLAVVYAGMSSVHEATDLAEARAQKVLLAYNPLHGEAASVILPAYLSVLQEEGVASATIDAYKLLDVDPSLAARSVPAVILPDGVCAAGFTALTAWLLDYLHAGGHVLLVYDVGSRSEKAAWQHSAGLLEVAGIAPDGRDVTGAARFTTGHVRLADAGAVQSLQIPPGKVGRDLVLTGYAYGVLEYPLATVTFLLPAAGAPPRVLAYGVTPDGDEPVIFTRAVGEGEVMYVGLPLGYLKGRSDDLPLRAVLRSFLFDRARMVHLLAVPGGIGGVVINWHVDSELDRDGLRVMRDEGLLRPDLRCSLHVCAGPDLNTPGDGLGFDACGKGRDILVSVRDDVTLGSHGGWIHNGFAAGQQDGSLAPAQVRDLIARNRDCLQSLGQPIREYSAPDGVHPQPQTTVALESLGFAATYYTGDGGSAPCRSFSDGRELSDDLVAFPVLPLGRYASVGEMRRAGIAPAVVAHWLSAVADYCEHERTVRLVYSHPYDLVLGEGAASYRAVYAAWLDDLARRQHDGRLQVRPMGEFADFLLRMTRTTMMVLDQGGGLRISLRNPAGLRGMTVAVPRRAGELRDPRGVAVHSDQDWNYYTITGQTDATVLAVIPR